MSEQMLQGENLALSVSAGQGCMEGLFLASSSSLFLRAAFLAAKALSKGGSTWVVSAPEISLANEWVCWSFRNKQTCFQCLSLLFCALSYLSCIAASA